MISGGLLWRITYDDPAAIIISLTLNMEGVPGKARLYQVKLRCDRGRQSRPFLPTGIDANRLRLERPGVENDVGNIGAFALEQHSLFAGRPIDLYQS